MTQQENFKCWIESSVALPNSNSGSLVGFTFAVKDNFAIAGHHTGCGCPAWTRIHGKASETSEVIGGLLECGARMLGRCVMDEMAYGIEGKNFHHGTPINPKDPTRFCGGSSCGCASAVAGGQADFGIGTDTAGSVRIPASWCGIFGFRPTHGRLEPHGVVPLAPSFDTVGWMARDLDCLERVSRALLDHSSSKKTGVRANFKPTSIVQRGQEGNDGARTEALNLQLRLLNFGAWDGAKIHDQLMESWSRCLSRVQSSGIRTELFQFRDSELHRWWEAFAVLQGREIIETHQDWLRVPGVIDDLAPWIANRFAAAMEIKDDQIWPAQRDREHACKFLQELFSGDAILCMPTTPGPAPLLSTDESVLLQTRTQTLRFSCLAALAGCPEITMPGLEVEGGPVGISLLAAPGRDLELTRAARQLSGHLLGDFTKPDER